MVVFATTSPSRFKPIPTLLRVRQPEAAHGDRTHVWQRSDRVDARAPTRPTGRTNEAIQPG